MIGNLRELIIQDEGCELDAYQDKSGIWTIGYGHNIESNGLRIRQEQAEELLNEDIQRAYLGAKRLVSNFSELDEVRQAVVVSMVYQMGLTRAMKFKVHTIPLIEARKFREAAARLRRSLWARQTPERVERLAVMLETGKWSQ